MGLDATPHIAASAIAVRRVIAPQDAVDHNAHLNVRYHFDLLCDAIGDDIDRLGFGDGYRAAHRRSLFTVEHSVQYRTEIHAGDELAVSARLDGRVGKALYYSATLVNETRRQVASSMTAVLLHIDLETRRAVEFAPHVADELDRALAEA